MIGAGYAHLAADDPATAVSAFRRALEAMPSNGRALLGLRQALARSGRADDAESLASRVEASIAELTKGDRRAEAAMLRAGVAVTRGHCEAGCGIFERLLDDAPPGQAGWMIPIDAALSPLREHPSFEKVLGLLSARAS